MLQITPWPLAETQSVYLHEVFRCSHVMAMDAYGYFGCRKEEISSGTLESSHVISGKSSETPENSSETAEKSSETPASLLEGVNGEVTAPIITEAVSECVQ